MPFGLMFVSKTCALDKTKSKVYAPALNLKLANS